MDITPVYELKARLRAAAIAGTNLISEDFRLKKAAESFAPLAKASPVFAKINEMTAKLLSDGSPENLLDTITLVDAVITTLGTVDVQGEIEDIPAAGNGTAIVSAPYSQLSAILGALTESGGGQYNTFLQAKEDHPELLNDYRVKPALVKGLGASYSELADEVAKTIGEMGEEMLPLLKSGFDPKGGKEMSRRIYVIEKIAGARENDFYFEQIENAEKDVRKMLVYALRYDENNIDRLIGLTKTEKGRAKDAAYTALAKFTSEKAAEPFRELAKKKPEKALEYLRDVSGEWQSELAAETITRLLVNEDGKAISINEALAPTKKSQFGMLHQMCAITGKTGSAIEKIYRSINAGFEKDIETCSRWLGNTILMTNDEELKKLAMELNSNPKMKNAFVYAEAITRLTGAEDCSKWIEKQVKGKKSELIMIRRSRLGSTLADVLEMIEFRDGKYEFVVRSFDDITDKWYDSCTLAVTADVKGKLTDIIMNVLDNGLSVKLLTNWIDKNDPVYCDRLAE
ncbi:MAG: hypothetical protein K2G32_04650, partial [Oscillospiraceae bacterium]|nr:hypothetical protein [Oscillospiraceae bacterium]